MAKKPERKLYRPTDAAGPYVAGQRVPTIVVDGTHRRDPAWTVELTEPQARYELASGAIEEVQAEPAPNTDGKGGKGGRKPTAHDQGNDAGADPGASGAA